MNEKSQNSIGIVQTQIVRVVAEDAPLELACGKKLAPIDVAYETYGCLSDTGDNVVLICHALSGNAHAAGYHSKQDRKPGWWEDFVGPGKPVDTNTYFVICSNILGGCSGTTGPRSINPATGEPYGLDFPMITIADMVRVQKLLLDKLGIKQLLAVIGGSMGGMQVLQWAIEYPDFVRSAVPVATTTHLGAQSIAFDAVGRNAIIADPDFYDGKYEDNKGPNKGLAMARMIGHITYLSEQQMREKFGRKLRNGTGYRYELDSEFEVESYLDYQGQTFVERFDADSYLYITKAMDYFDLTREYHSLEKAFSGVDARFLVISFACDWLFTPQQSRAIVNALVANDKHVSYCNIDSPYGHDAFLLEPEILGSLIKGFLDVAYRPDAVDTIEHTNKQTRLMGPFEQARRARVDYELIESLIEHHSSVLDVGCGDGELLSKLNKDKKIKAKGIELKQDFVLACVKRGVPVIQHNIEQGLANYADKSVDVVTLSQTLQTLINPERVFKELLRVGRRVIVSFPNFAHWHCRLQLLTRGKAPVTTQLPFSWYESPNIHFLSLSDFEEFCNKLNVKIEKRIGITRNRKSTVRLAPNLFAEQVIYVTTKD